MKKYAIFKDYEPLTELRKQMSNNGNLHLIKNKVYDIINRGDDWIVVKDERGCESCFFIERFQLVDSKLQWRKLKLKRILK